MFQAHSVSCFSNIGPVVEETLDKMQEDVSQYERCAVAQTNSILIQNSPKRRPFGDITNSFLSTSSNCQKYRSPIKHRRFEKKASNMVLACRTPISITNVQAKIRKRSFLPKKRISLHGIPVSAMPIRRNQSTSVLEFSFTSPDTVQHYSLRTVDKPQIDSTAFRSIDGNTLADLINSMGERSFCDKFTLIDCRYPFEYEGGHVRSASNVFDYVAAQNHFFPDDSIEFQNISNKIPIFYCEFSQKRGPRMAEFLRNYDRKKNAYPELDYPEIYLLDHGYRKFFNESKLTSLCSPQHYVPMLHPAFSDDLKRFRQHRKGSRYQTEVTE